MSHCWLSNKLVKIMEMIFIRWNVTTRQGQGSVETSHKIEPNSHTQLKYSKIKDFIFKHPLTLIKKHIQLMYVIVMQ